MSSIKVIFQKLPASELDFQKKLKSVSDSGSSDLHDRSALNEIQRLKIKQVSISRISIKIIFEENEFFKSRLGSNRSKSFCIFNRRWKNMSNGILDASFTFWKG